MQTLIHTLDNGISVLIYPDKRVETVCGLVGVRIGSNHEKDDEHGLAHFFEHMCFKGTETYPTQRELITRIDGLGVVTNAFTAREYTAYYMHGHADRCGDIVRMTADIFLHSLFPEREVTKEKGVVLEEIAMYEDDPIEKGFEVAEQALFAGTPSGHPIIGTVDSVQSFSRDRFVSFFEQHYVTGNTIISIAGNVDPDTVLQQLNEVYSPAKKGTASVNEPMEPTGPTEKHQSIVRSDLEQMRLLIGGYAPSAVSDEYYAALVFSILFGGSMSSRLFLRVREKMGACYDISAGNHQQAQTGLHTIATGIPPSRVEEVMAAIADECALICREQVSSEELRRAKDQVIGRLSVERESMQKRASQQFVTFVQKGSCESDDTFTEKINTVTTADVQRVAQEIYSPDKMTVCYVGNTAVPSSCSDTLFTAVS